MLALLQQSCAGCIEGSSPALLEGYLWGMAIMISAPFFLLAFVGGGLYYAYRQSVREAVERALSDEPLSGVQHTGPAPGRDR